MTFKDSVTHQNTSVNATNYALNTVSGPLNFIKYSDATYEYYCETPPGPNVSRSSPIWSVTRKTIATGDMVMAGRGQPEHAATNLATVAALTYTLGA